MGDRAASKLPFYTKHIHSHKNLERLQKTNAQFTKDLKMTPFLNKLKDYKRSWLHILSLWRRNFFFLILARSVYKM